jgi:hypothetical protein
MSEDIGIVGMRFRLLVFSALLTALLVTSQEAGAQGNNKAETSKTVKTHISGSKQSNASSIAVATRRSLRVQSKVRVGQNFNDYCVVAWPTAPEMFGSTLVMTMTCEHVPEYQYLFTQVQYGHSKLRVTPSTGSMHVIGKVIGVAQSELGYKELVVSASKITL